MITFDEAMNYLSIEINEAISDFLNKYGENLEKRGVGLEKCIIGALSSHIIKIFNYPYNASFGGITSDDEYKEIHEKVINDYIDILKHFLLYNVKSDQNAK